MLWLTGRLRETGQTLRAGDRISLGSFGPPIPAADLDGLSVTYEGLPVAEARRASRCGSTEMQHPGFVVLLLALLWAAGLARAEVAGSAAPGFVAAREAWLADDDAAALPALSALAGEGNRAAQVLLGLIDLMPQTHGPWLAARPRDARIALLRAPGGISGRSWLGEAAAEVPLARLWIERLEAGTGFATAREFAALEAWLAADPLAAPLRQFCAATCPDGEAGPCARAVLELVGGHEGLAAHGSPAAALIAEDAFADSPRGRAAILRAAAARDPVAGAALQARIAASDACVGTALRRETAHFAR